jgi:hypothetical protein
MIEEKIDTLVIAMNALTKALENITIAANALSDTTAPAKAADDKKQSENFWGFSCRPPEKEAPVTMDELQQLCLQIVRKDRALKTKITDIIKSHGGELLKDIPPEKYSEIKKQLEAMFYES